MNFHKKGQRPKTDSLQLLDIFNVTAADDGKISVSDPDVINHLFFLLRFFKPDIIIKFIHAAEVDRFYFFKIGG